MTDKELEFGNKLFYLANKVKNEVNEKEFTCPSCGEKAVLKISGEKQEEIWGYCDNCKIGFEGIIYD